MSTKYRKREKETTSDDRFQEVAQRVFEESEELRLLQNVLDKIQRKWTSEFFLKYLTLWIAKHDLRTKQPEYCKWVSEFCLAMSKLFAIEEKK